MTIRYINLLFTYLLTYKVILSVVAYKGSMGVLGRLSNMNRVASCGTRRLARRVWCGFWEFGESVDAVSGGTYRRWDVHALRSFRRASPNLWNQLLCSEFLIRIIYLLLVTFISEHAGLTCYTCYHLPSLFTVPFWAQNLPSFRKILSSTLVCFCLSAWSHGSRPFTGFMCLSVLRFSSISVCFSYYIYYIYYMLASSLVNF